MGFWSAVGRTSRSLRERLGRWYSPKEIRALALFLILGVAVLLFRGGKTLYLTFFGASAPAADTANQHVADSLFFALSANAHRQDSLIFSLPEDSIAPAHFRRAAPKGSMLAPNSIPVNSATLEQLEQLPGVGPSTAEKIIAYRTRRGGFSSVEEISNVKTIGKKRYARMRPYLRLN